MARRLGRRLLVAIAVVLLLAGLILAVVWGRGLGVLPVDYRGYGGIPGSPSEEGLAAIADAAVRALDDLGHPLDRATGSRCSSRSHATWAEVPAGRSSRAGG